MLTMSLIRQPGLVALAQMWHKKQTCYGETMYRCVVNKGCYMLNIGSSSASFLTIFIPIKHATHSLLFHPWRLFLLPLFLLWVILGERVNKEIMWHFLITIIFRLHLEQTLLLKPCKYLFPILLASRQ